MFFNISQKEKVDFFKVDYNGTTMKGAEPEDTKVIYQAIQNGDKLSVDHYGHVYNSDGRWIANVIGR